MKILKISLLFLTGLVLLFANSSIIGSAMGISATPIFGVAFGLSIFTAFMPSGLTFAAFTEGLCPAIQTSLLEMLNSKAPELQRTQVGYLDCLLSPENTAGVTMKFLDTEGKIKKGKITYIQRGCEDDIVHTPHDNCNPEVEVAPMEDDFEITQYIGTKWLKFSESNLRLLCEGDAAYRSRIVNAQLNALMMSLDKMLIAEQSANFGAFVPSIAPATYKDVQMLNVMNGSDPFGEVTVMEDFQNLGFSGRPMLIGAGNLSAYTQLAKIGCCNMLGQSIDKTAAFMFFRDNAMQTQLGANHFVAMAPGYTQLATWNKYRGEGRKVDVPNVFIHDTFVDPVTGLTIDLNVKYFDCDEEWGIQFGLYYKLLFIPTRSFAYCDGNYGVNYTLHYRATQASS